MPYVCGDSTGAHAPLGVTHGGSPPVSRDRSCCLLERQSIEGLRADEFGRPAVGEDRSHQVDPGLRPARVRRIPSAGGHLGRPKPRKAPSPAMGCDQARRKFGDPCPAIRVRASRFFWSVSGRVCRYFWVVWICAWPIRSITPLRSAPPASSQDAWARRRSWIRTRKSIPDASTAGGQTRVRKVLREIGVPTSVLNSSSSRLIWWVLECSATS